MNKWEYNERRITAKPHKQPAYWIVVVTINGVLTRVHISPTEARELAMELTDAASAEDEFDRKLR